MERRYVLYKHTNKTNGKIYIGITSKKPEHRWESGKGYIGNPHFYNAIQKYGWNGFDHEILKEGLTKDEAEAEEIRLIKELDLMNDDFGYNISPGGKLSLKLCSKPVNCYDTNGKYIETFQSITEAREKLGVNHVCECCNGKLKTNKGYTFRYLSDEFPKDVDIDFKYEPIEKPVNVYDMKGKYICSYSSISEASKITGIHEYNIIQCCNGFHYIAGNYTIRYLSDEFPIGENIDFDIDVIKAATRKKMSDSRKTAQKTLICHSKEILQYGIDGNFIKEWSSVSEASKSIKGADHAGSCANGTRKSAGGYIWKWKS